MTKEERENDCFGKLIKKDIPPMSTEQAIEVLHELDGTIYDTQQVALDMAIKALEQQSCDCVSRQAVLKQMKEWRDCEFVKMTNPYHYLEKRIQSMSPVTPTQSWIPVSERLPKESDDYLVTISTDIGAKEPVREVYKDFFCILSQQWLYYTEDVVAWQPLPKPYEEKRGSENE